MCQREGIARIAAAAALFVSVSVVTSRSASSAEAVTACGMVLADGGFLVGDLDCSGYADGPALTITSGTFDLASYTFTANARDFPLTNPDAGVECSHSCEIVGPGTITSPGGEAVVAARGRLTLNNVTITLSGSLTYAVVGRRRVTAIDSVIQGAGGDGIAARSAHVEGTTIDGNGGTAIAAYYGRVGVYDSEITNNGWQFPADAVIGKAVKVGSSTITGNGGDGINAGKSLKLVGSNVSGNGRTGIDVERSAEIIDSNLTGNCTSPGTLGCADVRSCERPRADNTTCGSSMDCNRVAVQDWGICSGD
jgi:hypothetical protein